MRNDSAEIQLSDSANRNIVRNLEWSIPPGTTIGNGCMETQQSLIPETTDIHTFLSHASQDRLGAKWHVTDRHLRAIVSYNVDAILVVDRNGVIRFANPAAEKLFDHRLDELIGRDFGYPVVDGETVGVDIMQKDGKVAVAEMRVAEMNWENEQVYLATLRDVTDRHEMMLQLERNRQLERYLAYHDTLTELPNRQLFYDRLRHAFGHASRHSNKLAVLFLDLDGFKAINDTHGHAFGDSVLQAVAQRLKALVRKSDTVARLGGDEFTIVLSELQERTNASLVAAKILEQLAAPFHLDGKEFFISTSIGISVYPDDGQDIDSLVRAADTAMYQAKRQGKKRFHFYEPNL